METLKPVLDNLQGQSSDIASSLNRQADTLGMVHRDVTGLMHVQQQDNSAILLELFRICAQIFEFQAAVNCGIGVLVSLVGNCSRDQER